MDLPVVFIALFHFSLWIKSPIFVFLVSRFHAEFVVIATVVALGAFIYTMVFVAA